MATLFKKRKVNTNLRKRATPSPSPSSSGSDFEDEDGQKVKRRKTAGIAGGSTLDRKDTSKETSTTTQYTADRTADIAVSNDATATQRQVGPTKAAPTNVRTTVLTDYAPDVCKDYKQTGFCGFGDSCKYLHMREDYKQGWAIDRDWEIKTKGKKQRGTVVSSANRDAADKELELDEAEAALLEKVPFACIICKEPYKNPIVTICGHYFCEACALQRYKKKPACAACGAGTNGVFNGARNLQKLLDKKRKREELLKEREEQEKDEDEK